MITTATQPLADATEVIRALSLILRPGQVTELRILDGTTPGSEKWPQTWSGYYDDPQRLAKDLGQFRSWTAAYIVPNEIAPALKARAANRVRAVKKDPLTNDGNIIRRRWLLIDADPVRPAGISSSDEEHDAALERTQKIADDLAVEGWYAGIHGDSANGGHLIYPIDLPTDDGGLVQRCLEALAKRYGDDVVSIDTTVANPARIWKLYGTLARKGDDTPDRPHRMARILSAPDVLTPIPFELLEELAGPAPAAQATKPIANGRANGRAFDIADWISRHHVPVDPPEDWTPQGGGRGRRWVFAVCPWNADHRNRSAYIVQFPSGAVEAGCRHDGCKGRDWHSLRSLYEPDWDHRKEDRPGGNGSKPAGTNSQAEPNFVNFVNFVPSPTETEPKEWPELHPDALYGLAGEIVSRTEAHTEADPVAILIQSLGAFGNAAGRSAYFCAGGSRHYCNLYTALMGNTSKGRKGTSWATVSHLYEYVCPDWLTNCVASGCSSGEGLIWNVRDAVERRIPVKAKGRFTGEYDTVIEHEGITDKRLLVLESEFANVLKVMQRDGNTLSPIIRNAWDTGNLRSMVKNSPAQATGAHISIIGHITIEELKRYMDRTEAANGLGNRFLWVCVRRSKCLPEGGDLQSVDFSDIYHRMGEALANARDATLITRDPDARELWAQVYPELSEGKSGMVGALTSRSEAQAMRLAMIYALMDGQRVVRVPHLKAALALWDYCARSVQYVFGNSLGDPVVDEVLQALRSHTEGMTRTDLSQHFGNNREASQISRALTLLSERGLARVQKEDGGKGRKVDRWFCLY